MPKNVICDRREDTAFPIELSQQGKNRFTVTYGVQVEDNLTYSQACHYYGRALLHALACEGKIDNSGTLI